jgi:hypothetical protein
MAKKTINELSRDLQIYDTRLDALETNTRKEQIEAIARAVLKQQMKDEDFQNKLKGLFFSFLKQEEFVKQSKVARCRKSERIHAWQNPLGSVCLDFNSGSGSTLAEILSYNSLVPRDGIGVPMSVRIPTRHNST